MFTLQSYRQRFAHNHYADIAFKLYAMCYCNDIANELRVNLMKNIDIQITIAKKTLEESKSRYANGLNDYLTVIVALQNLQNLQRQRIAEQRNLLLIRAQLYRAMGGKWLQDSLVNLQETMK